MWLYHFTNKSQGFVTSDGMLPRGDRESAQSAILVVSDGAYSFKYQTAKKAQEFKDKRIQILMVLIYEFQGKGL